MRRIFRKLRCWLKSLKPDYFLDMKHGISIHANSVCLFLEWIFWVGPAITFVNIYNMFATYIANGDIFEVFRK